MRPSSRRNLERTPLPKMRSLSLRTLGDCYRLLSLRAPDASAPSPKHSSAIQPLSIFGFRGAWLVGTRLGLGFVVGAQTSIVGAVIDRRTGRSSASAMGASGLV